MRNTNFKSLKSNVKKTLFSLATSIAIVGCGPANGLASGRLLFEIRPPEAELSRQKNSFKTSQPLVQHTPGRHYYQINTVRGHDMRPLTPFIHSYHTPNMRAPLTLALPPSFRWNIPQSLREQISRLEIDQLDIFFTPQEENRDHDASLKPWTWMFPNHTHLDSITGAPPELHKPVHLGVFESDYNISHQVAINQIQLFDVFLHDQLVSPNTGHLNTQSTPEGSQSFFSLAVFGEQRRAAVTLHWLLTEVDRHNFEDLLIARHQDAEDRSLSALLDDLNASRHFQGTQILERLNTLLVH